MGSRPTFSNLKATLKRCSMEVIKGRRVLITSPQPWLTFPLRVPFPTRQRGVSDLPVLYVLSHHLVINSQILKSELLRIYIVLLPIVKQQSPVIQKCSVVWNKVQACYHGSTLQSHSLNVKQKSSVITLFSGLE